MGEETHSNMNHLNEWVCERNDAGEVMAFRCCSWITRHKGNTA